MEESEYMAKMRVHELAKELEIKSQEIIESLSGTEYEIKSASNNIDDAAQEIIRKKYKKSAPKAEEKPAAEKAEKPAAPKAEEKARPEEKKPADAEHDRPKKKSSITAVFNAQYSKQGAGHGNNRRPNQGAKGGRSQDGRRPANDRGDRPAGQAKPAMSGNDMRKYFDSLINPNAGKETENKAPKAEEVKTETAQTAPAAQERVFKKPTENVYEQMRQQEKTSRPNQDNRRPQGDRPARNGQNGGYNNRANGDRPARPQGDRPYRNNNGEGGYNNRNNGDRPARQGDNRGQRPNGGNQRPFNNGRPGQGFNQGDRSGGRNNNFRGRDNGGRLDREIDKFNKDSAPLAEEMRGKETRERERDNKNRNGKQRGVRCFVLDENDPRNYKTYTKTYEQLCDGKLNTSIKDAIWRVVPTTVDMAKPMIAKALAALAAVVALIVIAVKFL